MIPNNSLRSLLFVHCWCWKWAEITFSFWNNIFFLKRQLQNYLIQGVFLVPLKVICLFRRVIFVLETIKGPHLNTYTGGFWYSMCTGLSGTTQKQANSYFMTLKISRILRFVYIFKLIYSLTMSNIPSQP